MSRAWFWSGCKSSTCMGIADAYLSDAITREVFAGFSSPLASVTSAATRSAALSLLLRIQVSKLPRRGEVVSQKQLGEEAYVVTSGKDFVKTAIHCDCLVRILRNDENPSREIRIGLRWLLKTRRRVIQGRSDNKVWTVSTSEARRGS